MPIRTSPLREARIEDALSARARYSPQQIALVDGETTVTYADLAARARVSARLLRAHGLLAGDRATIFLDKTVDAVATLYGVWLAGGVVVPAGESLKARQLDHILRHSESRCLVTNASKLALSGIEDLHGAVFVPADESPPTGGIHLGGVGGREPAAILYTSGSTGLPKGIVLSHDNLLAGTRIVAGYLEISAHDRILSLLPFSFDYGLNQLLTAVERGAALVLQRSHHPADVCRSLAGHRITGLAGVPPVWAQLMAPPSTLPGMHLPHLRYITNSGGTFPRDLLQRFRAQLPHVRIYLMYGLTEAFRSTYLPPELVDRLPDSMGKAIPETDVFVVDHQGKPCPPGEVGELVHRGPTVALGYWRDPQATSHRFRQLPWARDSSERVVWSGDLVRTDEQGFLYYVGRSGPTGSK